MNRFALRYLPYRPSCHPQGHVRRSDFDPKEKQRRDPNEGKRLAHEAHLNLQLWTRIERCTLRRIKKVLANL